MSSYGFEYGLSLPKIVKLGTAPMASTATHETFTVTILKGFESLSH